MSRYKGAAKLTAQEKAAGYTTCRSCGRKMNPVATSVSGRHGVCGACVRKRHHEAAGRR